MPKYYVICKATIATQYEVNAKNEAEAEQKFYDGEWKNCKELPSYDIDSKEEVLEVNKDELYF